MNKGAVLGGIPVAALLFAPSAIGSEATEQGKSTIPAALRHDRDPPPSGPGPI